MWNEVHDGMWEYARRCERDQRKYLADDVLKDPGSAVVWWLARNHDADVGKVADDIQHLRLISNAANNLDVTSLNGTAESPKSPADHLARFLQAVAVTEDSQALFADRVARVVEAHDQHDIAEEIRRRFTVTADIDPDDGEGRRLA